MKAAYVIFFIYNLFGYLIKKTYICNRNNKILELWLKFGKKLSTLRIMKYPTWVKLEMSITTKLKTWRLVDYSTFGALTETLPHKGITLPSMGKVSLDCGCLLYLCTILIAAFQSASNTMPSEQ